LITTPQSLAPQGAISTTTFPLAVIHRPSGLPADKAAPPSARASSTRFIAIPYFARATGHADHKHCLHPV
jgi:hypothetical protein